MRRGERKKGERRRKRGEEGGERRGGRGERGERRKRGEERREKRGGRGEENRKEERRKRKGEETGKGHEEEGSRERRRQRGERRGGKRREERRREERSRGCSISWLAYLYIRWLCGCSIHGDSGHTSLRPFPPNTGSDPARHMTPRRIPIGCRGKDCSHAHFVSRRIRPGETMLVAIVTVVC